MQNDDLIKGQKYIVTDPGAVFDRDKGMVPDWTIIEEKFKVGDIVVGQYTNREYQVVEVKGCALTLKDKLTNIIVNQPDRLFNKKCFPDKISDLKIIIDLNPCAEGFMIYDKIPCDLSPIKIKCEKSRGGNKMNVNVNTLIALASADIQAENEKYGALPISIKEALTHKMEERSKKVAMDAADNIIELLDRHEKAIQLNVTSLRELRRREKLIKDELIKAERAKAYGMATNNWVPLYVAVTGLSIGNVDKSLLEVPSDWAEPVAN